MFSLGTEDFFAFWMASNRVGFLVRSGPPVRAATSMFLTSFANTLARLESTTAFLCLVVAHLEWPDIGVPSLQLHDLVNTIWSTKSVSYTHLRAHETVLD